MKGRGLQHPTDQHKTLMTGVASSKHEKVALHSSLRMLLQALLISRPLNQAPKGSIAVYALSLEKSGGPRYLQPARKLLCMTQSSTLNRCGTVQGNSKTLYLEYKCSNVEDSGPPGSSQASHVGSTVPLSPSLGKMPMRDPAAIRVAESTEVNSQSCQNSSICDIANGMALKSGDSNEDPIYGCSLSIPPFHPAGAPPNPPPGRCDSEVGVGGAWEPTARNDTSQIWWGHVKNAHQAQMGMIVWTLMAACVISCKV